MPSEDLKPGKIEETSLQKLSVSGISLSENAIFLKINDTNWRIIDHDKQYLIKTEEENYYLFDTFLASMREISEDTDIRIKKHEKSIDDLLRKIEKYENLKKEFGRLYLESSKHQEKEKRIKEEYRRINKKSDYSIIFHILDDNGIQQIIYAIEEYMNLNHTLHCNYYTENYNSLTSHC